MINVSKLKKGIIIDHIESGHGFEIYKELHLNEIDDVVVLMKNVPSKKMGQKDLIKIETDLELDMNAVSYTHLSWNGEFSNKIGGDHYIHKRDNEDQKKNHQEIFRFKNRQSPFKAAPH